MSQVQLGVCGENWVLHIFRTIRDYPSGDKTRILLNHQFDPLAIPLNVIFDSGKPVKLASLIGLGLRSYSCTGRSLTVAGTSLD